MIQILCDENQYEFLESMRGDDNWSEFEELLGDKAIELLDNHITHENFMVDTTLTLPLITQQEIALTFI